MLKNKNLLLNKLKTQTNIIKMLTLNRFKQVEFKKNRYKFELNRSEKKLLPILANSMACLEAVLNVSLVCVF